MNILCFMDQAGHSTLLDGLKDGILKLAQRKGHTFETINLKSGDLYACYGCLRCWSGGIDDCISKDKFNEFREKVKGCDAVFFLTPALFGQFSSNIKNAIDRGIVLRLDHNQTYPMQFYIGYGEDLTDEEASTFMDIKNKHMAGSDVIHPEIKDIKLEVFVSRSTGDTKRIIESLGSFI